MITQLWRRSRRSRRSRHTTPSCEQFGNLNLPSTMILPAAMAAEVAPLIDAAPAEPAHFALVTPGIDGSVGLFIVDDPDSGR